MKILMIHGFASSPRELRPLGLTLVANGFEVMAPLLPGHGEHYPGMSSCRLEDWLGALRLSFQSLHRDGSPVALIGYCLGGALSLAGARELNPRAVVCLSTPLQPLPEQMFPAIEGDRDDLLDTKPFATDCLSAGARSWRLAACHQTVTRPFLQAYHETVRSAREQLPELRCPVAMFQGALSRAVGAEHSAWASQNAANTSVRVFTSESAGHAVAIDHGRRRLAREVLDFLQMVESSAKERY